MSTGCFCVILPLLLHLLFCFGSDMCAEKGGGGFMIMGDGLWAFAACAPKSEFAWALRFREGEAFF